MASEREASYHVGDTWTMPELTRLVPEGGSFETENSELSTSYYDTADGTLAALGITLRRRHGGPSVGWFLSLPDQLAAGTVSGENELHSSSVHDTVPPALVEPIEGLLHGLSLSEVATITTTRKTHVIRDGNGSVIVEIADDQVRGTALGEVAGIDSWRGVEVGAGPSGTEKALNRAEKILVKAGAEITRSQVKLVRLLDGVEPGSRDRIETTLKPDPLTTYVAQQCGAILLGEVGLRQHPTPEVVHATRVSLRRLRSTLRLFADLLDLTRIDPAGTLDDDLRWFASHLGAIRDLDVLEAYVSQELDALPPEIVIGPVAQQLHEEISLQRRSALDHWRRAWSEERYAAVIVAVESLHSDLPLLDPKAVRKKAWPRTADAILEKATRTARQRMAETNDDPESIHRARKAAKRLRYAADLVDGDLPRAEKSSKRAKSVQKLLGSHQDHIVAAKFLREQGARAGSREGHNGFTYGVLAERADQQARDIRRTL